MNILLASSEALPYSKTGGLADMVGALAKFLARSGHRVALVTPYYGTLGERFPDLTLYEPRLDVPMGLSTVTGSVWTREEDGLTACLVQQPHFFDRAGIYQEHGMDYPDNAERFIFLSKVAVHLAARFGADLIHLHDWQTGLAAPLARESSIPVCLTIHNLAFQGVFPADRFGLTNLPAAVFGPDGAEFYGMLNSLKAGIMYSDLLTTVSPRYAREITTESLGCGLDGALRARQSVLRGILNGVDYEEWRTENNPFLKYSYSAADLTGKTANKVELQRELGLPESPETPLFGTISRLTEQKGVDIQLGALEEMLAANMQFALLGSGSREFERGYRSLAERHPKRCAVRIGFDPGLSHRIEAASDFYLMPSRFEPCGLNQMYSLRYGAVPIVRMTGGLDDSVVDMTEDSDRADGIKFTEYSVRALAKAIRKALVVYGEKDLLQLYRQNGMSKDFSWERNAREYETLYDKLLVLKKV